MKYGKICSAFFFVCVEFLISILAVFFQIWNAMMEKNGVVMDR